MDGATTVAALADQASSAVGVKQYQLLSPTGLLLERNRTVGECDITDGSVLTAVVPEWKTKVFSSSLGSAFAAVKSAGAVITWGDARRGGNSSAVREQLCSDVLQVAGTEKAFAAVKNAGAVITWGVAGYGGDSSTVQEQL